MRKTSARDVSLALSGIACSPSLRVAGVFFWRAASALFSLSRISRSGGHLGSQGGAGGKDILMRRTPLLPRWRESHLPQAAFVPRLYFEKKVLEDSAVLGPPPARPTRSPWWPTLQTCSRNPLPPPARCSSHTPMHVLSYGVEILGASPPPLFPVLRTLKHAIRTQLGRNAEETPRASASPHYITCPHGVMSCMGMGEGNLP